MSDSNRTNTGPGEPLDITDRLDHMRENAGLDQYGEEVLYRAKQEIERLRAGLQEIHDMGRAFDRRPPTALGERLAVKKAGEILRGSS